MFKRNPEPSTYELLRRLEQSEPKPIGPRFPTGLFRIHDPRREDAVEHLPTFPLDHVPHTNS